MLRTGYATLGRLKASWTQVSTKEVRGSEVTTTVHCFAFEYIDPRGSLKEEAFAYSTGPPSLSGGPFEPLMVCGVDVLLVAEIDCLRVDAQGQIGARLANPILRGTAAFTAVVLNIYALAG